MASPPYQEEESSIKYYKPKYHTHKAKGLTFFASIFSLFMYISISYIFKLSPYTLFNNHIFWFLMSNTLILIIAADYRAFSSSKRKQDLHEDYVIKHSQLQTRMHGSSYVSKYEQVENKCIINPKETNIAQNIEVPERVLEIVTQNEPKKPSGHSNEKTSLLPLLEVDGSYKACEEKKVRRSETMGVEAEMEEENEFSSMTNEELNRKVEEFIQKFNRQIRLQATRNDSQT